MEKNYCGKNATSGVTTPYTYQWQLSTKGKSSLMIQTEHTALLPLRQELIKSPIKVHVETLSEEINIKELSAVINFDLAFEHDVNIQRIDRIGTKGIALSTITLADAQRVCANEDNHPHPIHWGNINKLEKNHNTRLVRAMVTLCLASDKKDKIRPGDILRALTKDAGLAGNTIGKINITAIYSYIAIHHNQADKTYQYLQSGKLKRHKVNMRKIN